jgi:hypothetical protein
VLIVLVLILEKSSVYSSPYLTRLFIDQTEAPPLKDNSIPETRSHGIIAPIQNSNSKKRGYPPST